jgi:hypothetical protein
MKTLIDTIKFTRAGTIMLKYTIIMRLHSAISYKLLDKSSFKNAPIIDSIKQVVNSWYEAIILSSLVLYGLNIMMK